MKRDGFRCILSGVIDLNAAMDAEELIPEEDTATARKMECCYIFPESTNDSQVEVDEHKVSLCVYAYVNLHVFSNAPVLVKLDHPAGLWTVLSAFGYPNIRLELEGQKHHRVENVMTFIPEAREFFDTLKLWFERVENQVCALVARKVLPRI